MRRKMVLGAISIVVLGGILWIANMAIGNPWEIHVIKEKVRNYVMEKYNITPKELSVGIFFESPVYVTVVTENVNFQVSLGRNCLEDISDRYRESLAEYNLKQLVTTEMEHLLPSNAFFLVSLNTTFGRSSNITVEEINSSEFFEKFKNKYNCDVLFHQIDKNNIEFDFENLYKMFVCILQKLSPSKISFAYYSKDRGGDPLLSVDIEQKDFEKITSVDKFRYYFKSNSTYF